MLYEHLINSCAHKLTTADHHTTMHNRVANRDRAAAQPCFNWISNGSSKLWPSQRPHGKITDGTEYYSFVRSLRVHELGHALGYRHVTAALSVMNATALLEPTAFDRDATRIAFDRQPGNRSPDVDPDSATTNRLNTAGRRWSAPLP